MERSAPQVLITDVAGYLGRELAKAAVAAGFHVYGITKNLVSQELLDQKAFTLLELDLSQPLPSHLPKFDLVFFLSHDQSPFTPGFSAIPHFSLALSNILSLTHLGVRVIITLPIDTDPQIYDYLARSEDQRQKIAVFLVGDVYGPGLDLNAKDSLSQLISQAINTDKVILKNEGIDALYPVFITDALSPLQNFASKNSHDVKRIHLITSAGPVTTLSAAYEIQKAARLVLGKEVDLFFSNTGPSSPAPQQIIKSHDLDHPPKVELATGIAHTLQYFRENTKVPASPPYTSHPPRVPSYQPSVPKERGFVDTLRTKITNPLGAKSLGSKSLKSNRRRLGAIIALIILLFVAKTALDLFLGTSRLNSARKAATLGDFQKAQSQAMSAAGSIKSAGGEVALISAPFGLIMPQKVQSLNQTFDSAENSAMALSFLAKGASQLATNISVISQKDAKAEGFNLESPQADFKSAFFASARAQELARAAKSASMFPDNVEKLGKAAAGMNSLSISAFELSNLLGDFVGKAEPKSYLLLLQNNTELRPGGGFIGNIGTIEFESGRLKNIAVDDVYNVDGQLKEKITPPVQIAEKLGTDAFYLRDSGWSPDFALNAQIATDFFKKETGKSVDGVISLDLSFLQEVLKKTGPVKLADYNEEITSENLFERGEFYSEVGFFPGSTQKKDFFGALTRTLINKTLSSISSKDKSQDEISMLGLIEAFKDGLSQKHVMLSMASPNLAAYIRTHDWNRPLPPASFNPGDDSDRTRDFLALSEANLGANKVNRVIDRKIEYTMTIGRDADLVANLKITYTNNSQADTWPGGKYVNYLRVYTPGLITILSANGSEEIDPEEVQVSTLGNLSSIATFVEVPIKSTKEVTFSYRLPKSIKLEQAPLYHLYVQKQPGTDRDPFEFKFNLPGYLVAKSVNGNEQPAGAQNLDIKTDLLTDREFKIEVIKK
ncbi:MAG: DUF4012 domain-containing protein [Candidatus Curtissbacteria bacterium]